MSWMDTRAYQPWVPDDPELAYATTSSGYMTHRFTGRVPRQRRQQHHPAVAHRHRHVAVGSGAVRAVQHAPGAARRAADAGRHRRLRDRRRGGGDRHPGGPAGRDHRQRQGGRGARLRLARRAHRARLAGHVHRLHGARAREPPGRRGLLDELRLRPGTYLLRERRRAPRHVDPQLVPRPAGAGVRRRGGDPGRLARGVPRARGRAGPRRELRPHDGPGLARPHGQALPQGRDHRLRRAPHQGARLPVDPRGDRADDEGERRRHVRRARHRPARDRRLRRRLQQPALHEHLRRRVRRARVAQRRQQRREPRLRHLRRRGHRRVSRLRRPPPAP